MACVFAGGLMLLTSAFHLFHGQEGVREVTIKSLHIRSIIAGMIGVTAFLPAVMSDYNVYLQGAPSPVTALIAVNCLLVIQAMLAITIADNPKRIRKLFIGFYIFAVFVATFHKTMG